MSTPPIDEQPAAPTAEHEQPGFAYRPHAFSVTPLVALVIVTLAIAVAALVLAIVAMSRGDGRRQQGPLLVKPGQMLPGQMLPGQMLPGQGFNQGRPGAPGAHPGRGRFLLPGTGGCQSSDGTTTCKFHWSQRQLPPGQGRPAAPPRPQQPPPQTLPSQQG